jgi:curli biogenesis system outer membrane secretion channel CsgG
LLALLSAAAPVAAQSKKDGLERCAQPIAALAVLEPKNDVLSALRRYELQSPTTLIRTMAQQSNCFVVVERGAGMQTMQGERDLARSGELQEGSNIGGGQMKAADYYLTPNVLFSEGDAGGVGAAVGGLLSRRTAGVVGAGLKFKEASTTLLLGDVRSGVQIASAEGKAKTSDLSLAGIGFFGTAAVGFGGYTKTNEGKVIAKSFLDNFNKIVLQVRSNPELKRDVSKALPGAAAVRAGASFNEGDVLTPKIENVKLVDGPTADAAAIATLRKGEEVVYMGEEKDGFVKVAASAGEGWVRRALVQKK